tara:strand:+ start:404 stop:1174 length:771 start_codon:yes stop_codon:yes gene_type:complete
MLKKILKKFISFYFPGLIWKRKAISQNDDKESQALLHYAEELKINKSFVEFGFGPFQYNTIGLTKRYYKGLLIDGTKLSCDQGNKIFKSLKLNVTAICHWITLENLEPIINFVKKNDGKLGVLSVDIDGNDYWILKKLLTHFKPEIICVEYNASFLMKSITIPYASDFDRHKTGNSGLYHGASITAFYNLLNKEYALVKNIAGLNLIFIRNDICLDKYKTLRPEEAYSENYLRNKWSNTTSKEQWKRIKDLKFIEV